MFEHFTEMKNEVFLRLVFIMLQNTQSYLLKMNSLKSKALFLYYWCI